MEINKAIHEIIEDNMMGFSQYVIKNRSLPNVYDGLKPIHQKILWTMYEDNITKFTKSETVAGRVMAYSPHGSCYETIVNMVQKDRHCYPLIEGQGNFGSYCSNELHFASSRYSECKLSELALDSLKGIDYNMVDMILNYDSTKKMPKFIPVRFPQVLTMSHNGIAVGMASNTPSFNLKEVCEATIDIIRGNEPKLLYPDFATGGYIVDDKSAIASINNKGVGTVELRAKYRKEGNTIVVYEIPYGSKVFVETIIDKIIELVKLNKIKEITNVLNQGGYKGLAIEIECKKGTDLDMLMNKLYALTPLASKFSCNMNVLVDKNPRVLGVYSMINEWLKFRRECVKRGVEFKLGNKSEKLHILEGLEKVILDIDRCIAIIRNSEEDMIIQSLMNGFNIDEVQAKDVASMKLRNINKKYILKQIKEIEDLRAEVNNLKVILETPTMVDDIIVVELQDVIKKFSQDRRTIIIDKSEVKDVAKNELVEDYNCNITISNDGWIKKCLKASDSHKLKDGDFVIDSIKSNNRDTLYLITNKANRYKLSCDSLEKKLPSTLGQFIPSLVQLEGDEKVIKAISVSKPVGYVVCVYENGKIAKIDIKSYMSNNTKLVNCFNTDGKLIAIDYIEKDCDVLFIAEDSKALIVDTSTINSKGSKSSQGNIGIKLNDGNKCIYSYINVPKDFKFAVETKTREIDFMLDDIAPTSKGDEDRTIYTYLKGRTGNKGNKLLQGSALLNVINNK